MGQRIKGMLCYCYDASGYGDLLSLEALGVAVTIPAFRDENGLFVQPSS